MGLFGGIFGGGGKSTTITTTTTELGVATDVNVGVEVSPIVNVAAPVVNNILDLQPIAGAISASGDATRAGIADAAKIFGDAITKAAGTATANATDNRKALIEWGQAATAILALAAAAFALWKGGNVRVEL